MASKEVKIHSKYPTRKWEEITVVAMAHGWEFTDPVEVEPEISILQEGAYLGARGDQIEIDNLEQLDNLIVALKQVRKEMPAKLKAAKAKAEKAKAKSAARVDKRAAKQESASDD